MAIGLVNQMNEKPTAVALNSPNDWKWVHNIQHGPELKQHQWAKASVADFLAYAVAIGILGVTMNYCLPVLLRLTCGGGYP